MFKAWRWLSDTSVGFEISVKVDWKLGGGVSSFHGRVNGGSTCGNVTGVAPGGGSRSSAGSVWVMFAPGGMWSAESLPDLLTFVACRRFCKAVLCPFVRPANHGDRPMAICLHSNPNRLEEPNLIRIGCEHCDRWKVQSPKATASISRLQLDLSKTNDMPVTLSHFPTDDSRKIGRTRHTAQNAREEHAAGFAKQYSNNVRRRCHLRISSNRWPKRRALQRAEVGGGERAWWR